MKRLVMIMLCVIGLGGMVSYGEPQKHPAIQSRTEKRQQFIEGISVFHKRDYEKAIQIFEVLHNRYPELQEYVDYFLAKAYDAANEDEKALKLLHRLQKNFPSHPLSDDVRFTIANVLFEQEHYQEALNLYRVLYAHSRRIDRADLLYKLGQAFMHTNHLKYAVTAFHHLVLHYPKYAESTKAKDSLNKILSTHQAFAPTWTEKSFLTHAEALLQAGLYTSAIKQYQAFQKRYPKSLRQGESEFGIADAYFRLGKSTEGTQRLKQIATQYASSQPELAAKALYTIGVNLWNTDQNQHAKQYMERIAKNFAGTTLSDNAHYVLGRILQEEKAYHAASQWYMALYVHYPESPFAEESLWRAGWSYYLNTSYTQAIQIFSRTSEAFPAGSYSNDSLYWKARSLERQDKHQEAINIYLQLIQASPDTYYGLQARERLRVLNVKLKINQTEKKRGEYPQLSVILTQFHQAFPPELTQELSLHIGRAIELSEVQLYPYARKELEWCEELLEKQQSSVMTPDQHLFTRYVFSRLYAHIGEYLKTIQLVAQIESLETKGPFSPFPYALEQLKYPLAYWELIEKYAIQNQLDPFLVAGIIRQESAYAPDARSSANARGLMQIIPTTGKLVAKKLGLKNFSSSQLYEPETNIILGTSYLAELLEKFNGNLYRAIAAYNAGPEATNKWWSSQAQAANDDEETVENISYRATRNYVKHVMRNQHNYRTIYPDLTPSQ